MDKEQLQIDVKIQTRLVRECRGEIEGLNTRLGAQNKLLLQMKSDNLDLRVTTKNLLFQNEGLREQLQHLTAHGVTVRQEHYILNEHVVHEDPFSGAIALLCLGAIMAVAGAVGCFSVDGAGKTVPIALVIIGSAAAISATVYCAHRMFSHMLIDRLDTQP